MATNSSTPAVTPPVSTENGGRSVETLKWILIAVGGAIALLLIFGIYSWIKSPGTSTSTQTSEQKEKASISTIVVSQLSFNPQGYSIHEISKKTQIHFNVPGYQFDISGTAKLDDVCTIKNGKVIDGTLPPEKEYYTVTPQDKIISLTFKKN